MLTGRITVSASVAGQGFSFPLSREAEGGKSHSITLPAAKPGELTTRTDVDTGTLTMEAGHGITTGAIIGLYWDGGCRYNVVVGTVDVNSVPFDLGAGDDLPDEGTDITAQVEQEIDDEFEGDDLIAVIALCSQNAVVSFFDVASNELAVVLPANEGWYWVNEWVNANPIAGDSISKITVSQGGSEAATFKLSILYDSTV